MAFLHPEYFWFFFLLIIPIVVHLFFFRNKKVLYFSSLKFIKNVDQSNKSYRKLKQWLILLTRLLILSSLIVAFAQPIDNNEIEKEKSLRDLNLIYIDNSFSMQSSGSRGELLSESREIAKKYISGLSANSRFIIQTNKSNGLEKKILNKKEALQAVDLIDYFPNAKTIEQVITWQNELQKQIKEKQITRRIFISDFQKMNLNHLPKLNSENEYSLINVQPTVYSNLSVDSIWFDTPIHKIGVNNKLNIRVQNYGLKKKNNVELTLDINGIIKTSTFDISPNSTFVENFEIDEAEGGQKKGKITVNDDHLVWDDDFWFTYEVTNENEVIIVNGEDASNSVSKAFTTEKFINISEVGIRQLNSVKLTNKNLIVLNGINEISSGLQSILDDFQNDGGKILIIPGSKINNINLNKYLKKIGLSQLKFAEENSFPIEELNYMDPFFHGIFSIEKPDIRINGITKLYPEIVNEQSRPLLKLRNGKTIFSYNRNGAFLFHFSLSEEFGSFYADGLFSILLLRIAELSNKSTPNYVIIGSEDKVTVRTKQNFQKAISLKNEKIEFFPKSIKKDAYSTFSLGGIEAIEKMKNGIYSINGTEKTKYLAVNYDKKESSVDCYTEDSLKFYFNQAGAKIIKNYNFSNGKEINFKMNEDGAWWRYFLILALVFIFIEMILLKFMK